MKTLNFNSQKKRQSAFTLIEIMVATVIMVVLTGLVIQITSEVLKVWSRSSGKLAANAEARIAMDSADAIIFVVDARAGINPIDEQVSKLLHLYLQPLFKKQQKF